ncbi:ricin B lectin [Cutaneotrichosporon oleaginosum]|uniref:Ricin B lectin n=1 Tax=Cutaneotrichosporon oleaginosum TaxID=879819 RepID=A0A0J0XFH4_9TREE|nr:ricin B lectin [Cutaneotrichosporon oleaginosum]KLT39801.1 ricin B lectin [Cutaneotrichosporon oleaginosum]TXT10326.1 hypothetical protein COLE_04260 [Cutaneotrichosporon oleaginosum]
MLVSLLLLPLTLVAARSIRPAAGCGKCLDVVGVDGNAGAARISSGVTLNDCNGSSAQNWEVQRGVTLIRLAGTQYCVDVGTHRRGPTPGWNPANGEIAKLYPCTDIATSSAGQVFEWNGAKLHIKEKAKGDFCLDVKDGNTSPGNQIQMWTCFPRNTNQQWSIV